MKKLIGVIVFGIILFSSGLVSAAGFKDKIGINEKLGNKIPLDATFYDSNGKELTLGEIINKPTVIDFAYYKCTGICTPLMTEVADVINRVDLKPGKDYDVITISFNADETPKDAYKKKQEMINLVSTGIPDSSWRFLTGDSLNIKKVTEAAGFNFEKQDDTFIHTGVLIFVSADGKICRYLRPGFSDRGSFRILPFDFKMALIEASKDEAIPVIDKALKYCFAYQPKNESYVLNMFNVSGAGILIAVAVVFIFIIRKPKKAKS